MTIWVRWIWIIGILLAITGAFWATPTFHSAMDAGDQTAIDSQVPGSSQRLKWGDQE